MPEFIGSPLGEGRRVALVCSRFNIEIVQRLHDGAYATAIAQGVAEHDIDVFWVPGAWEIPVTVRRLLESERYDALVTLGAVIRGDTPHFDYVAGEAARGVHALSLEFGVPVAFGVLTTDDDAQAEARAGGAHGNKGSDAVLVALEMADLFMRLDAVDDLQESDAEA
jgi:6,7-dimethyl-8-ribityllumazine synthase